MIQEFAKTFVLRQDVRRKREAVSTRLLINSSVLPSEVTHDHCVDVKKRQ